MINTSSIKPLKALLAALISGFPTAVCLCDLSEGLDQLSDLLTFQQDCWLQEEMMGFPMALRLTSAMGDIRG